MSAKRRLPVFYKVYFVLIAIAVVGVVIGAFWLRGYLAAYEDAQPYHVADAVFEKYYSSKDFSLLAEITHNTDSFEGYETVAKYLRQQYGDSELTYTSVSSMEEGILKYIVKAGDCKISSFSLRKSGEITEDGFELYTEDSFEVYYSANESITVLAPEFSDVYVNDKKLDETNAVETDIILMSADSTPENVIPVQYTRYTVDGLIEKPTLKVMSDDVENGVIYNDETKEYEASLPNNAELEALYKDFVIEAVKEYAVYMGNDSGWGRVRPYFDPTTDLYTDIRTVEHQYVYPHSGYRFDEEYAGEFYAYDENTFSCRVYVLHVLENPGMADSKDKIDMTVYLRRVGDKFLIFDWTIIGE